MWLQDIAVDGWALTLLPPHHIEYASTCQTLGMNTGYFTSFTIFLALSNAEFCNKYIRSNSTLAGARLCDAAVLGMRVDVTEVRGLVPCSQYWLAHALHAGLL
jgi:hypothetical protein